MKGRGPYTIGDRGKNEINLQNILVGDVWLCTAQSNIVHQMILSGTRQVDEIANANNPEIRQFWVPNVRSAERFTRRLMKMEPK